MATYNIKQYRNIQKRRAAKLRQLKRRGPITSAKYMAIQLRQLAPYNTGRVINSIRRSKNTVKVSGSNPSNGFPYIHWINATPGAGLQKIAYRKKWFGDETKYTFNQAMRNKGYKFYQVALRKTVKHFRNAMLNATDKVLSAEF